MSTILLSLTLAAEVLAAAAVLASIAFPRRRIWPPPRQRCWQGYLMWFLFLASAAGAAAVGIAGWGELALPPGVRLGLGLPLVAAGILVALWAMAVLGLAATLGGEGALARWGPYRFSRHPQYVGYIAALLGWALLASSLPALVVSLVGTVPLLLVPFAEEPWLLAQHGPAYEEYRRAVARLLGWRRP